MKETGTRPMVLNLRYFGEGAGGEGGGESGSQGAEGESAAKSNPGRYRNIQSARPGKEGGRDKSAMASSGGRDAKAGEALPKYKNVQRAQKGHPGQTKAQEAEDGDSDGDTLDAEFEEMIRGKYRDAWQKRADAIVNRRFAQMKALQESHTALSPLLDRLASRYGTEKGDIQGLMNALDKEEEKAAPPASNDAENNRLTAISERLREMNALRAHEREMQERIQRQQRVNAIHQRWREEVRQTKEIYPGFDFDRESRNPDFSRLISAGIPVRHAYEVLHRDEILGGAMHYTAQKTREKLAADIAARGLRPAENGLTGQTAVMPGFRYERLSKAAKAEIERRALRGEKVNPRDYMDYK